MSKYLAKIGLEMHCEISETNSKVFSSAKNDYSQIPNSNIRPVDMAFPGILPVVNKEAVRMALMTSMVLNCSQPEYMYFERKNYYYPDLPKSYQISQYDKPLCNHGYVEIDDENGNKKKIGILRIHIEEDAGKLNHDEFGGDSLVDLNRAGVPLIEIVSMPDMSSAEEADRYLKKLKSILEYIEVSDCKMQEGSFRADVNVSVKKKTDTKLGTRSEMKNMSSFRSITRGIEYEIERQIDLLEAGEKVLQETLRWDDVSGRTFSMRDKEDAQDYRYFPEPDLVAIKLSDEYIENVKNSLPELPESRLNRYVEEYKMTPKDAGIIVNSKYLSDLFEKASSICNNYKAVSNWIISDITGILNEKELEPNEIPFTAEELAKVVILIDKGTISSSIGKKVVAELFENPRDPEEIIKEKGWIQISDEGAIKEVVMNILEANPQSIADFKAGKDRALGFLVGQAMKQTKGKANPQLLNKMFLEELKK